MNKFKLIEHLTVTRTAFIKAEDWDDALTIWQQDKTHDGEALHWSKDNCDPDCTLVGVAELDANDEELSLRYVREDKLRYEDE